MQVRTRISSLVGYAGALMACGFMALSTGCASGGFQLTRKYAGFVNQQHIVIRIVLYLLTGIVFAVTLLVDMVIFNTMDFWEGRVSAGEYNFNQGERTFHVRHEIQPGSTLKKSTIQVFNKDQSLAQTVILQQTIAGEIELHVDGVLRSKVRDIQSLPVATIYDSKGTFVAENMVYEGSRYLVGLAR